MKSTLLKRSLAMLLISLMLIPSTVLAAPLFKDDMAGYTVILHTNDSHGRIDDNMGFTTVAALKKAYEAKGANVLVLDAGDTFHGLPVINLTSGENAVKLMNAVGYDAMAPGNHDFNYGASGLKALEKLMDFPLLAANVKKNGSAFAKDCTIITKAGVKYGIFGLTTPETAFKTNPKQIAGITFEDPIKTAKAEVAELTKKGADVIIALCHVGLEGEYTTDAMAKAVPGIDVIIDGHSHSKLESGMAVGETLIASTGEYIGSVGVVTIAPDGKKTASLVSESGYNDDEIDELVASMKAETEKLLNVVIGKTTTDLDGARENVRARETNLGNLIADAMRQATGADIAMENGGGVRATIPAGDITKAQVLEVLPFANYVVTIKVTGADILAMLEHGVNVYPELSGGFPQVSGMSFLIDPNKPAGSRVSGVMINGKELDKNKTYTLAINDFTAVGGDGYDMIAGAKLLGQYPNLEEVVMDFLAKNPSYTAKVEGRITFAEALVDADDCPECVPDTGIYVVKKGDCLWSIALELYGDSSEWRTIYDLNRDLIHEARVIRVGMELKVA